MLRASSWGNLARERASTTRRRLANSGAGGRPPSAIVENLERRELLSVRGAGIAGHAPLAPRHAPAHAALAAHLAQETTPAPAANGSFSFAVMGDTQAPKWYPVGGGEKKAQPGQYVSRQLALMAQDIAGRGVSFVLDTGDLVRGSRDAGLAKQLRQFDAAVSPLINGKIPIVPVLGNHELYVQRSDSESAQEAAKKEIVGPNSPWSREFEQLVTPKLRVSKLDYWAQNDYFTYGNATFVGLNTFPTFTDSEPGLSQGAIDRLKKVLEDPTKRTQGAPVFVFGHTPLLSFQPGNDNSGGLFGNLNGPSARARRNELMQDMTQVAGASGNRAFYLAGHIHLYDRSTLTGLKYGGKDYRIVQLVDGTGGGNATDWNQPHGLFGKKTPISVQLGTHRDNSFRQTVKFGGANYDSYAHIGYSVITVSGATVSSTYWELNPTKQTFNQQDQYTWSAGA